VARALSSISIIYSSQFYILTVITDCPLLWEGLNRGAKADSYAPTFE